jgi:hypothetical protein
MLAKQSNSPQKTRPNVLTLVYFLLKFSSPIYIIRRLINTLYAYISSQEMAGW